jgi:hypothetical protein
VVVVWECSVQAPEQLEEQFWLAVAEPLQVSPQTIPAILSRVTTLIMMIFVFMDIPLF